MLKYIENTSKNTMFVGSTMIPPGEGKLVDVPHETAAPAPPVAGPSIGEMIRELLEKSVKDILVDLPTLTNEALDLVHAAEAGGKARTTLLAAVGAEQLRRAGEALAAEEAQRKQAALEAARADLEAAKLALAALTAEATEEARSAAEAAVADAQAKVDALDSED